MINDLLNEIIRLKRAIELLERLFSEFGPYRDGKITDDTWYQVREFFGFDDSE